MPTKAELMEEAEKLGLKVDMTMTKAEIAEAIEEHRAWGLEDEPEPAPEPEPELEPVAKPPGTGAESAPVDIYQDQPGAQANYPPPAAPPPQIPPGMEGTQVTAPNLGADTRPPQQQPSHIIGRMKIDPALITWELEPGEQKYLDENEWNEGEFMQYSYHRQLTNFQLQAAMDALANQINKNTGWHKWQCASAIASVYSGKTRPPEAQSNAGICHPNIGTPQLAVEPAPADLIMEPHNLVSMERDTTQADIPTAPPQKPRPVQDTPELRRIQGVKDKI